MGNGAKHRAELGSWAEQHCLADDSYDGNISSRNKTLNEATVLHMLLHDIMPRTKADYYGLCHYRRFLNAASVELLEKSDFDIICAPSIPMKVFGQPVDVATQYAICHYASDLNLLRDTLNAHGLLDEGTWSKWLGLSILFAPCNIFVAKKEVFKEHASALLDVAVDIDSQLNVSRRDNYQKRAASFLTERANSYLMFKALEQKKWHIGEASIEEHLDWKPEDAKDQRGMYSDGE